uniref:Phospholipase A2 n=1 Tax=Plectus sambesii TaxID=2011161 RepID=A0A914ULE6_9BILA
MDQTNLCIAVILPLFLQSAPSFAATMPQRRIKRDMFQFCDMIQCATKQTCLSYLDHGCWCGLGNKGTSVMDGVDECCRVHDACYASIKDIFCVYYVVRYDWSCQDSFLHGPASEPVCSQQNQPSSCASMVCQCDAEFSTCIRRQNLNKDVRCTLRN